MFTATASACAVAIHGLLHSFRQHMHNPPLKVPVSSFHFSNTFLNLPASKKSCEPMKIKNNFSPESLNNFLNINQNSPNSTVPLTQNAAKDQTTPKVKLSPKVKLLCSFGGKFMPQHSDEILRYVGGQSRIISISRDITMHKFYCKMQDVYSGPVHICYQLPDEGLDTLVSVYSSEDFENMMEEIDSLSKASKCGCTKLWLFLFSPFGLEDVSGRFNSVVFNDCGLSYINTTNKTFASEANVNGRNSKAGTINAASTVNLNARCEEFINEAFEHQKFPAHSNVADTRNLGNQLAKDIRRHPMHQQKPHGYRTYDESLKRLRSQLSDIFNNNRMNNIK